MLNIPQSIIQFYLFFNIKKINVEHIPWWLQQFIFFFKKKKPVISTKRFKYMSKVGYLKLIKYKRLACLTAWIMNSSIFFSFFFYSDFRMNEMNEWNLPNLHSHLVIQKSKISMLSKSGYNPLLKTATLMVSAEFILFFFLVIFLHPI